MLLFLYEIYPVFLLEKPSKPYVTLFKINLLVFLLLQYIESSKYEE